MKLWPSVFSGFAVISNRITPSHRDDKGHHPWYDILFSGGRHTHAWLETPDIGASFLYKLGCLVGICGKTLRHAVLDYEGTDRFCIAHYMRYPVVQRIKPRAKDAGWVGMDPFLAMCHGEFQEQNRFKYTKASDGKVIAISAQGKRL